LADVQYALSERLLVLYAFAKTVGEHANWTDVNLLLEISRLQKQSE